MINDDDRPTNHASIPFSLSSQVSSGHLHVGSFPDSLASVTPCDNEQNNQELITETQALIQGSDSRMFLESPPQSFIRSQSTFSQYHSQALNSASQVDDEIIQCTTNSQAVSNNNNTPRTPTRRSRALIKNLTSASLKKRMKKRSHCKYCQSNNNRLDLESHLQNYSVCAQLYMREFKVSCIDAVLIKCFQCLNCTKSGKFHLKRHLEENMRCFLVYKKKFNVENTSQLSQKLKNLNRQSCASRQTSQRRLEYKDNGRSITISEAINNFKRSIALSNYRLCVKCSGHYLECNTTEISNEHSLYSELDLKNKPELRRMNKYYCCTWCSSSSVKSKTDFLVPSLKTIEVDGFKILYPAKENEVGHLEDTEFDSKTLILIPRNLTVKGFKNIQRLDLNINKCETATNSYLTTMYNNQLFKYIQKKFVYDRFEATIENHQNRVLSDVKPILDDSEIRLSDRWFASRISGLQARFDQFGPTALAFAIQLKMNTPEIVCTALLIQNSVLTLEFKGDQNYDMETRYFLHNHDTDKERFHNELNIYHNDVITSAHLI